MWKRQQLFQATDFQSLMYVNFISCRILGIFPYKINASTFKISRQRYILATFLICVTCITNLLILHEIFIIRKVNFKSVTRSLEAVSYFMFSGFIGFITYVLSSPRMHVLQAMLKISSKLPPESYQKLCRWIHLKDILGSFLLVMHICFCHEGRYLITMLSMYMSLVVFHMDMQYVNCVCILKTCFKRINNSLVHMHRIMANDIKPCVPNLICHIKRNQFLLIELRTLKKQHLIVNNTAQILNVIFSLQLLASTAITFTEITFELYTHLMRWQNGLSFILDDHIDDVFFLMSMGYNFLKLILIVWACETSKTQAFKINTTVHDVLNRANDEEIKEEMRLFSLQILHCENTFSTKGVTVNATLLVAMTGSITTYIIILTQFLVMSHSCDERTASNITRIT